MSAPSSDILSSNGTDIVSWRQCEVHTRSTFNILSLCISTLVICVWNVVHHDVPFPKAPRWTVYLRRFSAFLVGLFLPEVLVLNAMDEFIKARQFMLRMRSMQGSAQCQSQLSPFTISYWTEAWRPNILINPESPQWSMTHAFFAVMGGFVAKSNSGRVTPLATLEIQDLCQSNRGMWHLFAPEGIEDHSKAGALAKALFCWQLLVFTVGCAARRAAHLSLSLLEITTLAHSLCGLTAFALWWAKPHSVDEVVVVPVDDGYHSIIPRPYRIIYWIQALGDWLQRLPFWGALFIRGDGLTMSVFSSLAVAILYGFPHLLALSAEFPTPAEQRGWQLATAIIIVTPLSMVALWRLSAVAYIGPVFTIALIGFLIAYPIASCFIVVESVRQLFALPSDAFLSPAIICYLPKFS